MKRNYAIVKYNGGNGALLCNGCGIIIAYGYDHEDKIHLCDKCKNMNKEIELTLKEVPKL